ncbi:carbohydrate ABC transporter permease [Tepidibacter thalassicus]|uniref:Multiple sugar transport system permease protein n=1 Tax=Tepidibacter thalassicus DSM 15285 TaxID=1123350 RepID=A0A1M5Q6E8_9FIRM|nr:carbohydrate ABC transporter permease [Tepidibacter thalassicus]SHH09339.1 multiple sugar transport system permease protein [Tepidibacter thalassicus DSM 15285]
MKSIKRIAGDTILLVIASCMMVPFVYMVMTSLKVTYTAYNFDFSLSDITFRNYINIFRNHNFMHYFFNSTFIALGGVILNVLFSSLAGFAFAKKDFPGNEKIFFFMIMTLIIPSQVTMIPLYIIMKYLGWINTYYALILPIPTAFGVFLMRQAILNIPNDLIESARIDGCSDIRIFFQIVLPLIKPAIITLSIFTFVGAWNEFLWPLIMTTNDSVRTLTVGLSTLNAQYTVNYGLVMAGATLTFLPSFIFYLILQKKFVEGVTLSGIKG